MMLNDSVLVLNRSWLAINVANVRRAITLVYQDLARVVSPEDFATYDFEDWRTLSEAAPPEEERIVRTINFSFRVPEVIVLTFFNGVPRKDVPFSRRSLFERDRLVCQYCGERFKRTELTVDHVVPRSLGGRNTWENLVLACVPCNGKKANRAPDDAGMSLIRPARKPDWLPYAGTVYLAARKASWQKFIDTAYWDTELED